MNTSVILKENNFTVLGTVEGSAIAHYILGINLETRILC
jgi:hypothetical protein